MNTGLSFGGSFICARIQIDQLNTGHGLDGVSVRITNVLNLRQFRDCPIQQPKGSLQLTGSHLYFPKGMPLDAIKEHGCLDALPNSLAVYPVVSCCHSCDSLSGSSLTSRNGLASLPLPALVPVPSP
jgi:hypothetical protein